MPDWIMRRSRIFIATEKRLLAVLEERIDDLDANQFWKIIIRALSSQRDRENDRAGTYITACPRRPQSQNFFASTRDRHSIQTKP